MKNKISFQWNLQNKKKSIILISTIILIIMTIAFGPYIVADANLLFELNDELDLKKRLFAIKETNFEAMNINSEKLLSFSNKEQQKIQPYDQLPGALAHASQLMEACGVTETEFILAEKEHMIVEPWNETNELIRIKIKMEGMGKYPDVKKYIHTLMNDDFYYHLDVVILSSKNMTNRESVHVMLEVSIFLDKAANKKAVFEWPEIDESKVNDNPFYYEESLTEQAKDQSKDQ